MTGKVLETTQSVFILYVSIKLLRPYFKRQFSPYIYNVVCICNCLLFQSAQCKLAL